MGVYVAASSEEYSIAPSHMLFVGF